MVITFKKGGGIDFTTLILSLFCTRFLENIFSYIFPSMYFCASGVHVLLPGLFVFVSRQVCVGNIVAHSPSDILTALRRQLLNQISCPETWRETKARSKPINWTVNIFWIFT